MDDCPSTRSNAQLFGTIFAVRPLACVPLTQISEARGQELVNPDPCLALEVFNSKISVRLYGCRSEIGERDSQRSFAGITVPFYQVAHMHSGLQIRFTAATKQLSCLTLRALRHASPMTFGSRACLLPGPVLRNRGSPITAK
ncbi:hypothetical protein BD769DRAFT_1389927 [Suillus cothurnatus]|nr:hypothetical protein BD769DRAFT_1389927 [Suillus cothurnatus]